MPGNSAWPFMKPELKSRLSKNGKLTTHCWLDPAWFTPTCYQYCIIYRITVKQSHHCFAEPLKVSQIRGDWQSAVSHSGHSLQTSQNLSDISTGLGLLITRWMCAWLIYNLFCFWYFTLHYGLFFWSWSSEFPVLGSTLLKMSMFPRLFYKICSTKTKSLPDRFLKGMEPQTSSIDISA